MEKIISFINCCSGFTQLFWIYNPEPNVRGLQLPTILAPTPTLSLSHYSGYFIPNKKGRIRKSLKPSATLRIYFPLFCHSIKSFNRK